MIRGKVVRIPGGIVVRWPDEPENDVERAAVRRQHQLEVLARARAAAANPTCLNCHRAWSEHGNRVLDFKDACPEGPYRFSRKGRS